MKIYLYKKRIKENNYFLNCYRRLIRSKIVHFLFSLCDIIILILHEIDIFKRDFKTAIKIEDEIIINPIILIIQKLNNFPDYVTFLIVILPVIVFDAFYIYLCEYNIKNNNMFYSLLVNFFELFYFRLYVLLFYCTLFTLIKSYFIIAFAISIFDGYLIMNNFLYNHLYSYVPEFVDYPYDEFSSMYDLCLFVSKAFISAASNSTKIDIVKFLFIINLIIQIYFCFYFIQKLFYQSYLFMKNSFLNRTKLSLFLSRTTIIIISYLIHKNNLFTILHIFICFDIIIIFMGIIFVYDPFSHIYIENNTSVKNILFYLNVINYRNDVEYLIEHKIINHYKGCGLCDLCQKYAKFRKKQNNKDINVKENENEKDLLITNEDNKIYELFDVIYDGSKKYFKFIFKVIINYKKYGKNSFTNNINYFINFLNLIISDYNNKDINLSYNEKIILEIINKENLLLDSNRLQFNQLVIYNEFNTLIRKVLDLMKETLRIEQNFLKFQNLMILSKYLNQMKDHKFKKYLFNNKLKNITNSQPLLLSCSILYEEILNITLNTNNHLAVKDNAVLLEDFSEISENNMITLEFDIKDFNCKIIRAGKDLISYINFNLYDLFPPFLKQYQKNLFINLIFTGFNKQLESGYTKQSLYAKKRKKIEFIEFQFIFSEKNDKSTNDINKNYFKLINLKFTCLFNNDYKHYILLNGNYSLNKNIVISIIDLNHVEEIEERVIGVSNQKIENIINRNALSFKDINSKRSSYGIKLKKLFSYQISFILYNIYNIDFKNSVVIQTKSSLKEFRRITNIEHNSEGSSIKSESEKKTIYNDINSISSSIKTNENSTNVPARNRKIRKDYLSEYYDGYYKIKRIIYASITITILLIIVEILFFYKFKKEEYNCDLSYNNYKSFYRLYNQLFISVLSVTCFSETVDSKNCRNIISIFNNFYKRVRHIDFNFTYYMIGLNQVLSQKLMEEKTNIIKIIDYIGKRNYRDLFDKEIKYIQINKENSFSLYENNLRFFDAILILCNSFRFLTENSTYILTQPIYFLNKAENPFTNLKQNEMSSYQEEVYKLILNYKYFSQQFQNIDNKIKIIINKKINLSKILIYTFLNINIFLFLIIFILLYYYLIYFNKIIIHLLNYILMVINTKDDHFNFCVVFTKKIENLEAILELYKVNPIETIKKLNSIYNDYNKYLERKKSQLNLNKIKKEKKEMIEIPRHQRVISLKDIRKLNINKKYIYFIIIIVLFIIIIYIYFLLIWRDYFSTKLNILKVIDKNAILEKGCYEATNIYELMIFNNYTIDEIIDYMNISYIQEFKNNYFNYEDKNYSNIIFNRFYQQLYLLFDVKKDKQKVSTLYEDFDDSVEFNCSNLYTSIKLELLEEVNKALPDIDLKTKLTEVCKFSKLDSSKDVKTLYERHFEYIKTGIISLTDFSYEGLNKNINDDIIGKVSFFFLSTTIYIIEVTTGKPHVESVKKLHYIMSKRFLIMEIIFVIFGVVLVVIIILFYFYNINELYQQIFLLKKTFNIYKSYE